MAQNSARYESNLGQMPQVTEDQRVESMQDEVSPETHDAFQEIYRIVRDFHLARLRAERGPRECDLEPGAAWGRVGFPKWRD